MHHVLQQSHSGGPSVSWKNGCGRTTELALWPPSASFEGGDFDWRLSAAEIGANVSFSPFQGCERISTVTSGAGLVLAHGADAPRARLRRLEPYRFSGDWPTTAELVAGPVADFGVILRRGRATGDVQALRLGARRAREMLRTQQAFVYVLAGALAARVTGEEEPFELEHGDSLWLRGLSGGEELELVGAASSCELLLVGLTSS